MFDIYNYIQKATTLLGHDKLNQQNSEGRNESLSSLDEIIIGSLAHIYFLIYYIQIHWKFISYILFIECQSDIVKFL